MDGLCVGDDVGAEVGEEGGGALRWGVGLTRGVALLPAPCQDSATYPPSGTVSEPAPADE